MDKTIFEKLREFTNEANQTNSILDKVKVIEKYPDLKELFVHTYDTINYTYGITSDNLKKLANLKEPEHINYDLFELLNLLNERKLTGHNAIKAVNSFIDDNLESHDLIYNILDRNLKTRTDSKLINRVWPGLIPEFEVALAETYDVNMNIDFSKTPYYASRKCDGVRLITIIRENKIEFMSRQGKKFETLSVLEDEIKKITSCENIVLDGELCLVDKDGNENFQNVMKEIKKKDHTILNPMYMIFDVISIPDFYRKFESINFMTRQHALRIILPDKYNHIKILDQIFISNNMQLEELITRATTLGWEGLILRKAYSPYEGKRSKNLLKVKQFHDAEYKIKDIKIGPIRHILDGREITSNMLSNIIIEHKGNEVGVGSGLSIEQRLYFKDHPEELLGKVVTVTYFEETKNQDGSYSLRFPTVKVIHGGERKM